MNLYLAHLLQNFDKDEIAAVIVQGDREIAVHWRDLEHMARSFLAAYRGAGLESGAVVMIFLRHIPELYGSFFGAMLGGFVPTFMPCPSPRQDPRLYWESHQELLARTAPGLVVADTATHLEMAANGLSGLPTLAIEDLGSGVAEWAIPTGEQTALLQHSSGTTGLKKGVAVSYDALVAQIAAYSAAIELTGDDVIVSWLPLYHDMGLIACCVMPIAAGIKIVHLDAFEWVARPERLFQAIARHRGTLCWLPNFAFDHLSAILGHRGGSFDLSTIRAFINCSEPCRTASFDRFHEVFALKPKQFQCCYAMAETVFAVTQTPLSIPPTRIRVHQDSLQRGCRIAIDDQGTELIESGFPVVGAQLSIHAETDLELAEGYIGEIAVASTFLFSGYNHEPQRTAERLIGDKYFTRDLGFVHDGRLYVLGRIDDLIIISGRNIYAHQIEAVISTVDGVKPGRAIALGAFDDRLGTQALIVVVERHWERSDLDIRHDIANAILSVVNVAPRTIHVVEPGWLIKTTSGKVSREANLRKWRESN